jgi:2,5-furandicarboxylate decarboxylase 1
MAEAARDLRAWLEALAREGRLLEGPKNTDLRFELAAFSKRTEDKSALIFPNPGGHPVPVVSNLLADRKWIADSLGVTSAELLARFSSALKSPVKSVEVKTGPAQEIVHRENIDLLRLLPVPTHNELDSGPYISAGVLFSRNPETGIQNLTIHRCQISGPDKIGVLLLPRHTLAYVHRAAARKQALEVAIVIGLDPATLLASQAIAPLDFDELEIAGALHGKPVEVVKCLTNNVRVPAHSEIVIEGHIVPDERAPEGPFGEFPQYYGPRSDNHVIHVDAVTHRRNPVFHTIVGGSTEHLLLGGISREATLLDHLKRSFPEVKDVHLARGGVCRYHLVVQMEKKSEGQAKNVIMGAFGGHYDIKQVVVVDMDVNIHDPVEVQWAIATRFQADRDLIVIPGAQGSRLDPSARSGVSAKMGIDATVPLDADPSHFLRIRVPGQEEIDLHRLELCPNLKSILGRA